MDTAIQQQSYLLCFSKELDGHNPSGKVSREKYLKKTSQQISHGIYGTEHFGFSTET